MEATMLDVPIAQLIKTAEDTGNPASTEYTWHEPAHTEFQDYAMKELKEHLGMCLDCVRRSSTIAREDCRIEHK